MAKTIKRICIYLEYDGDRRDIRAFRAAAECMRAGMFMAEHIFYTPSLASLAAILARSTARPQPSDHEELKRRAPLLGDFVPTERKLEETELDQSLLETADPFLAITSRYWSPETIERAPEFRREQPDIDLLIALTPPQEGDRERIWSRSKYLVGFHKLERPGIEATSGLRYLDMDWRPSSRIDPETERFTPDEKIDPPFGLLLQSYALSAFRADE